MDAIHIELVGVAKNGKYGKATKAQLEALKAISKFIVGKYDLKQDQIYAHPDISYKYETEGAYERDYLKKELFKDSANNKESKPPIYLTKSGEKLRFDSQRVTQKGEVVDNSTN